MRRAGQRLTSLVSTSVSQAFGLTLLSLQVSMSDARHAQFGALIVSGEDTILAI